MLSEKESMVHTQLLGLIVTEEIIAARICHLAEPSESAHETKELYWIVLAREGLIWQI